MRSSFRVAFLVFCLCASAAEPPLPVPFTYRFFRSSLRKGCEYYAGCVGYADSGKEAFVEIKHSEPEGLGVVSVCRSHEKEGADMFKMSMTYSHLPSLYERMPTKILYNGPGGVNVNANVVDFYTIPYLCEARVTFVPPKPPSFDWCPIISPYGRPEILWMCECDSVSLTCTRFLFNGLEEETACFFSVKVHLAKLSKGVVSWGLMNLSNNLIFKIKGSSTFDYSQNFIWEVTPDE